MKFLMVLAGVIYHAVLKLIAVKYKVYRNLKCGPKVSDRLTVFKFVNCKTL